MKLCLWVAFVWEGGRVGWLVLRENQRSFEVLEGYVGGGEFLPQPK